MKKENKFLNLLKAMRLKRTLPILTIILIPAAYSNKFMPELILLAIEIVLIYSASSIFNAYKDKDYKLPKYFPIVILFMVFLALLISLFSKIIFFGTFAGIILGYIYNTSARFITIGDALIAGITHFSLPFLISSLLVRLNIYFALSLSSLVYFIAICIGPLTNLKDIKKDKKLGYKTLVNKVKNPYKIAKIFLNLSFIIIVSLYLLLGVKNLYLLLLIPIFLLEILIIKKINLKKSIQALDLMRFYLILSFVFLILILTSNIFIVSASLLILSLYSFSLLKIKKNGKL